MAQYDTLGGLNVQGNMSANGIANAEGIADTYGAGASGFGYGGIAAGISSATSIFSAVAGVQSFKAQIEAETESAIQNAGNAITSFELQQSKNKESIENLNNILGDKLSERGLTAMKEASMLRTAAAETGTSGGTTDVAIKQAFINENMDKANIVSSARQQTRNILTSMETNNLSTKHQIDSILLGSGSEYSTNSLIAGLQGGLQGFTNTMSMMPVSERAKVFGIKG